MAKSVRTVAMLLKDTLAIRERSSKDTLAIREKLSKDTLAIREKSINEATELLKKTSVIREKREEWYKETGMAYNVFEAAGISRKEVQMCNVLTDLLKRKGLHYQGNLYLKHFRDMVVIPHIKKAGKLELSEAKVKKQSSTKEGRLIDIEINDGKIFIPIEVKIKAPEQPKQLSDYADYSREKNKIVGFIPVLFLTPNGDESKEAKPKDYVCISFEKDIIPWLEVCLRETEKAEPVREIIKQYIIAIKSFY